MALSFRLAYKEAAQILGCGGVIAYPTEAVYGLGCDPSNSEALKRLLEIKGRPSSKGFILVASSVGQLLPYIRPLERLAMAGEIIDSWPGPNTWILPARRGVSPLLTGGRGTLAVRVSAHPVVRQLCDAWCGALVSTSANLHGGAELKSRLHMRRRFRLQVDCFVPGMLGGDERPSCIRDGRTGVRIR